MNAPLTRFSQIFTGKGENSEFPAWICLVQFTQVMQPGDGFGKLEHGVERPETEGTSSC